MSLKLTNMLVQYTFFSEESEKFYDGLLKVAATFGQERDMAIVYIAIGSLFTNAKVR